MMPFRLTAELVIAQRDPQHPQHHLVKRYRDPSQRRPRWSTSICFGPSQLRIAGSGCVHRGTQEIGFELPA
jgi:hypothetical protein